jgi:hypothetical protein
MTTPDPVYDTITIDLPARHATRCHHHTIQLTGDAFSGVVSRSALLVRLEAIRIAVKRPRVIRGTISGDHVSEGDAHFRLYRAGFALRPSARGRTAQ